MEIVRQVYTLFVEKGWSLSVAESCTGGLLSHYLTLLPGASKYFRAGVVAYSTDMKRAILGIHQGVIDTYGVVSEQVAGAMAERIREITGTDYSISTTGNLGPDVLEGKERGLVYVGISGVRGYRVEELHLTGGRDKNKEDTVMRALALLLGFIKEGMCK